MANKKFEIPASLLPYFEQLARLGIYGGEIGQVATFILRKEVMRLLQAGVLTRTEVVVVEAGGADNGEAIRRPKPRKKPADGGGKAS